MSTYLDALVVVGSSAPAPLRWSVVLWNLEWSVWVWSCDPCLNGEQRY